MIGKQWLSFLVVVLFCGYHNVFLLGFHHYLYFYSRAGEIPRLSNLDHQCLRCLCYTATECNITKGCEKGYCGPYKISRVYWKDANEVTLPDDDKERAGAYEDCALSYPCAQRIVLNYLSKYGRDCNEDGVTDCEDYMMINFNGGWQCQPPLNRSQPGKEWLRRYKVCDSRGT